MARHGDESAARMPRRDESDDREHARDRLITSTVAGTRPSFEPSSV
jgi:hypothetical protein